MVDGVAPIGAAQGVQQYQPGQGVQKGDPATAQAKLKEAEENLATAKRIAEMNPDDPTAKQMLTVAQNMLALAQAKASQCG